MLALSRPLLALTAALLSLSLVGQARASDAPDDGVPAEPLILVDQPAEPAPPQPVPAASSVVIAPAPSMVALPAPSPPPPPPPRRRGIGLMVTGYTLFGVSYMLTALSGAAVIDNCSVDRNYDCRRLGRSLMVPALGPFMALREIQSMTARFTMVLFPGLMQVGGLTMGIAGSVLYRRSHRHAGLVTAEGIRLARRHDLRLAAGATRVQLTYRF